MGKMQRQFRRHSREYSRHGNNLRQIRKTTKNPQERLPFFAILQEMAQ